MSLPWFNIIVCVDARFGISKNGETPWDKPDDLINFRAITTARSPNDKPNLCIMGRKTFEQVKYLHKREILVISTSMKDHKKAVSVEPDFASALKWASRNKDEIGQIFVCGGSRIYNEAIRHPAATMLYINKLDRDYECDNLIPDIQVIFDSTRESGWEFQDEIFGHRHYFRRNLHENAYLDLLKDVIGSELRPNRTGIPSYSKFAQRLEYPLIDGFGRKVLPLLTTKRVPYKLVLSELLWIMNGGTDTKFLLEHNNHIWDGNSTREFLNKRGLGHYEVGELGPLYGFQWRFFGSSYMTNTEYKETGIDSEDARIALYQQEGYDQITAVIESIRTDPFSRRHVVSAWNPPQLKDMALAPCHFVFMFYVSCERGDGKTDNFSNTTPKYLSCHLVMRSNDMFLGHPFNVASYATLTHMIAAMTGLTAKELVITMNDCHVYSNHVDQVKEQTMRSPCGFPTMEFSDDIKKKIEENTLQLEDFNMSSIIVNDYTCWKTIKADMAV